MCLHTGPVYANGSAALMNTLYIRAGFAMSTQQQITIDGNQYGFESGEAILQVAVRKGIKIPILCYLKGTNPAGACRMCLVEVKGARSLVASCATPASPGKVRQVHELYHRLPL
jgi:predicted molibdopterin-dependent oxidoreductase YjgC